MWRMLEECDLKAKLLENAGKIWSSLICGDGLVKVWVTFASILNRKMKKDEGDGDVVGKLVGIDRRDDGETSCQSLLRVICEIGGGIVAG